MSIEFKSVAFTADETVSTPYTVPDGKTAILIGVYFRVILTDSSFPPSQYTFLVGGMEVPVLEVSQTPQDRKTGVVNCRRVLSGPLPVSFKRGSDPASVGSITGTLSIVEFTN